jgi:hypothetical protein
MHLTHQNMAIAAPHIERRPKWRNAAWKSSRQQNVCVVVARAAGIGHMGGIRIIIGGMAARRDADYESINGRPVIIGASAISRNAFEAY